MTSRSSQTGRDTRSRTASMRSILSKSHGPFQSSIRDRTRSRLTCFAGLPRAEGSFRDFLDSLPHILEADSFRSVARGLARAARAGKGVLWMLGGHTIKTGLAPIFVRMMELGRPPSLPETAPWPSTTMRWPGGAPPPKTWRRAWWTGPSGWPRRRAGKSTRPSRPGPREGMGFGEALGWALSRRDDLVAPERSLLLQAYPKRSAGGNPRRHRL